MKFSSITSLLLLFAILLSIANGYSNKKSRRGKVVQQKRHKVQSRDKGLQRAHNRVPSLLNRRTLGAIDEGGNDLADCQMSRSKVAPPPGNGDILLGSKGAVAALGSNEKGKTLICMMKAFEVMEGKNGVIVRKTNSGLSMITNDDFNLDNMLTGDGAKGALHIGLAGQSSLRKGSKKDESSADLNVMDEGAAIGFDSKTRYNGGAMETSGKVSGSTKMSEAGRQRLQMNTEEETLFDSNKKTHARNDELSSMMHNSKTDFDINI